MPKDFCPYLTLGLFTNAENGRKIAVSSLWVQTIEECDEGTELTFTDGTTLTVREDFQTVVHRQRGPRGNRHKTS